MESYLNTVFEVKTCMDIRVFPVGGFNEVGKNMTAVKVGEG